MVVDFNPDKLGQKYKNNILVILNLKVAYTLQKSVCVVVIELQPLILSFMKYYANTT